MNKITLFLIYLLSVIMAEENEVKSAPTFFARTLENKNFYLSDELKKEIPIVLSFFATWCGPCRVEMPVLDSISTEFPHISFYLVDVSGLEQGGVKLKEDPVKVKEMVESLKVEIPVLMDKYGLTAEKYDALILPTLVVIDNNGKIVYKHTGYKRGDELELIKILRKFKIENE